MKIMGMLFLLVCSPALLASVPVFTLEPVGTLPTTIMEGTTATVSYTVTNNTHYTLQGSGLRYPPSGVTPVGVTQAAGGCADPFTLTAGASCTLNLLITADNLVNGRAVGGPEVCNTKANPVHCSIPSTANQLNISTIPFVRVLSFALGQDLTGTNPPLLVQTIDVGTTWANVTLPVGSPSNGTLNSGACNSDLCFAFGIDNNTSLPFLLNTLNDGGSWTYATASPTPSAASSRVSSTCATSICVATGAGEDLIQTTDTGANWDTVTPVSGASYSAVACSDAICVAGGEDNTLHALLIQSLDTGASWNTVVLPSESAVFNTAACSGNFCVAAGSTNVSSASFMKQTSNAGASWADSVTPLSAVDTILYSSACYSDICVVGGLDLSVTRSVLLVTTDAGGTWSDIPAITSQSALVRAISCSASICVAVGKDTAPFLYQSTDGGVSWSSVSTAFLPSNTTLNTASCDGDYCIIAGVTSSPAPILAQTQNAGTTWALVTGLTLPSSGQFIGGFTNGDFRVISEYFYFDTPMDQIALWGV